MLFKWILIGFIQDLGASGIELYRRSILDHELVITITNVHGKRTIRPRLGLLSVLGLVFFYIQMYLKIYESFPLLFYCSFLSMSGIMTLINARWLHIFLLSFIRRPRLEGSLQNFSFYQCRQVFLFTVYYVYEL